MSMEQNRGRTRDTIGEALESFPDFVYDTLPSASTIRLLDINLDKPSQQSIHKSCSEQYIEDIIVCSLHNVDLDSGETPAYDALSYTWGNPFSIYRSKEDADKANLLYATKVPIICNGMVLYKVGICMKRCYQFALHGEETLPSASFLQP